MELPDKWTMNEFNELLDDEDPSETLAYANLTQDDVQALAAWALRQLIEDRGNLDDELPALPTLIGYVVQMGVGMFAAGMLAQQLADRELAGVSDGPPE